MFFLHKDKTIGHIGLLAICGNSVSCIVVSAIVDKLKVNKNIAFDFHTNHIYSQLSIVILTNTIY